MNSGLTLYKSLFSKWLMAAVLLLSFFAFSGSPIQSRSTQNLRQTEATCTTETQIVKTVSYKRALNQTQVKFRAHSFVKATEIDLVYFHNLVATTSLTSYKEQNVSRLQNRSISKHTLYPHNQSSKSAIALA